MKIYDKDLTISPRNGIDYILRINYAHRENGGFFYGDKVVGISHLLHYG